MISKTYFSIVSFFVFIFSILFVIFITLQNGLFIKEINISNLHIKQLYIKWNEKIDVSLKELNIDQKNSSNNTLKYEKIGQHLKSLSYTTHWFNSIIIENININGLNASFKYKDGENGFILAKSTQLKINADISFKKNILCVHIENFKDLQRDIKISGDIYLDTKSVKLYTKLNLAVAREADLTLYLKTGLKHLSYNVKSKKSIHSIKNLIALAHLPKAVLFWAYEAIEMRDVELQSAYGYVDFDSLSEAYKNIKIKALVNKLHYTYNKKLDKIHAQTTELEFLNGILFIRPKQAYSYGMYLGDSWLKIDFTKKEELLTLKLLFNGKLNKDMLHILEAYKIKLPFLQRSGSVKTDLTIKVGLRNIDINAKGNFFTKKANFDYIGLNIDIYDANIKLNNFDVSIKNMRAKYKDILKANVDVNYNAATKKGKIDFRVTDVNLKGVTFQSNKKPQVASYNISPSGDLIKIAKSQWKYHNQTIMIDALELPFDLNKLRVEIPTTFLEIKNIGTAFASGNISLKDMSTSLEVDVLNFTYDGVKTMQSNTSLNINYNGKTTIKSKDDIFLSLSGTKYKLSNLLIEIDDEYAKIKHTDVVIGKYISTKLYAKFNKKTEKSHISLNKFILVDPNTHNTLYKNSKILLSLKDENGIIKVHSKELDAYFTSQESGWRLKLNSLGRVAKKSALLTSYFIHDGDFILFRNKNDKHIQFISNITYPYQILLKGNQPTSQYTLKGNIYKERVTLSINDNLKAQYKESIKIDMTNCNLNIFELTRLIKDIKKNSQNTTKKLKILLHAKNAFIYVSKNRKVVYDILDLQYFNTILSAQLIYKNGSSGLKLTGNDFHLYGKNFNDVFMNKLFDFSKFTGGSLDFSLSGKLDEYSGVMYITQSTMKDYKALNNILAFVNTVPSLVTFKLPGYNKKGLFVDNAYIKFNTKDDIYNLSDIYLTSQEMDIVGKGVINLKKRDMDLMLNLKTDLGSDISKIPVVGYILLDKDTISTTLSITGSLDKPKIQSHIATNIVVAPINIITRTLKLPYKLLEDVFHKKEK